MKQRWRPSVFANELNKDIRAQCSTTTCKCSSITHETSPLRMSIRSALWRRRGFIQNRLHELWQRHGEYDVRVQHTPWRASDMFWKNPMKKPNTIRPELFIHLFHEVTSITAQLVRCIRKRCAPSKSGEVCSRERGASTVSCTAQTPTKMNHNT